MMKHGLPVRLRGAVPLELGQRLRLGLLELLDRERLARPPLRGFV
jgi:hypothetical protein